MDGIAGGVQAGSDQLFASGLHQGLGLGQVVAVDGLVSSLNISVGSAFAVLNAVQIADSLHGLLGTTVGGGGIVVNVVEVQGVHQSVSGLVAGGNANPVSTVDGQGECLTEVDVGQNNGVGVALALVHSLQSVNIGVEEEGHGVGLVDLVHLGGGSVVSNLVSGRSPLGQLALQEGQLSSLIGHNVDDDLGGLILLHLLAVNGVVGVSVDVAGLGGLVVVPVLVTDINDLLAFLQGLHLVGAVGHGGFQSGAVVGGDQSASGVLTSLVQILVNQPVAGAGGQEVVVVDLSLSNITDGVVVNLVAADSAFVLALGIVVSVLDVVGLIAGAFAPSGNGDNGSQQSQGLVGQINLALSVSQSGQRGHSLNIKVGSAIVVHIELQGVAAQPGQSAVGLDVQLVAVSVDVDAVFALHSSFQIGSFNNSGLTGIVVVVAAGNSGLTAVVQVSTVVLHGRIQQGSHGVDVSVSIDGGAILPLHIGVQLDLEDIALDGLFDGLALGQSDLVGGQVSLMVSGHVGDGLSGHEHPLVNTILGVLNGHGGQGGLDVGQHAGVSVGFPSMGVPVVAQCGGIGAVGEVSLDNGGDIEGDDSFDVAAISGIGRTGTANSSVGAAIAATSCHGNDHQNSKQQS